MIWQLAMSSVDAVLRTKGCQWAVSARSGWTPRHWPCLYTALPVYIIPAKARGEASTDAARWRQRRELFRLRRAILRAKHLASTAAPAFRNPSAGDIKSLAGIASPYIVDIWRHRR